MQNPVYVTHAYTTFPMGPRLGEKNAILHTTAKGRANQ